MTNKLNNLNNIYCYSKMNYNNQIDLTKYGTTGIKPQDIYKPINNTINKINNNIILNNPCKLNEGFYKENMNYRNKLYSCYKNNNNHKRYGYYDLPCLKSSYKNTNYYDLNKNLLHFYYSHNY